MVEIRRVVPEVSRRSKPKHPPHPSPGHAGPGGGLHAAEAGRLSPVCFRGLGLEPERSVQR
jgi:hypothetical protein